MKAEPTYTISALALKTGVTARTIRYYTAEGLLPEPATNGRYAQYTAEHVARLAQIAQLKAQYLPLRMIRERLEGNIVAEANTDAPQAMPPAAAYTRPNPGTRQLRDAGIAQAAGLKGQHTIQEFGLVASPVPTASDPLGEPLPPIQIGQYQFFPDLPERLGVPTSSAASTFWERITLAPGIELHISEATTPHQRERVTQLLAAAQEILGS